MSLAALATALFSLALVGPGAGPASAAPATTMVNLGTAASYAVLSGTSVGNTVNAPTAAHTTLRGDLGVSSGAEPTGFPPGVVLGTKRIGAGAVPAVTDLSTAYGEIAGRSGGEALAGDLAGRTLTPGLYAGVGALANTGTIILDGQGDPSSIFVFKVDGALAMAAASHVTLAGGAQASRVFWQVNGATSVGASSTFAGTIIGNAAIAMGAGTMVNGRALTSAGAVTLDSNEFYSIPPVVTISGGSVATTTDTTPAISGTTNIIAPAVVTVTVNGQTLTTAPAADGSWTVTSGLLANATYPIVASVSDPAGNAGSATQSLTVDTVLPLVTIDGGAAVTTNDTTPTISGTTDVAVGQTVLVSVSPQTLTALVQSGGTWNVTPNPGLADGTRTVTATVSDPAGNLGSASQALTVDTVAPAVTITGGAAALTKDSTPTITGTAGVPAGRTVSVTVADQTLTGLVEADGTWSVTSALLTDGPHLVTMSVSDVAGNPATTTQTLTVDTVAPGIAIDGGTATSTNDLTPTISGTTGAGPGTTVTVTIAGQTMTTLVQANGSWNATPSTVSEGSLTVVASVPDVAGNIGSATQILTVDTAGPVVTINGGSSVTTSDATPTLSGASADVAIGSTVTVTVAGQTLTTTMQPAGTWTVTPSVILNGTHFVFVTVTDPGGNQGSATQSLTINAVLPEVSIDGGATAGTNDETPTITGTTNAATGSAVSVTVAGQTLSATVQPGGSWTVTAAHLADGPTTVSVTVTDPNGNAGSATQTLTINPPASVDGGSTSASNDTTPTISGTTNAPDGQVATVTVAGQTLTSVVSNGTWSVTATSLPDGTYDVVVSVSDPDGSPDVATQTLTIDTVVPVVVLPGGATVVTDDPTPPITGSGAQPGSTVSVTVGGQTLSTVVAADGTWSVTPTTLAEGDHLVVVTITDPAGNAGTGQQTITVDVPAAGSRFTALAPARILDTRIGNGAPTGPVGATGVVQLQVTGRGGVPADATAVVLNVTSVTLTGSPASYMTAWPTGETRPLASNLNYVTGQVIPNLVTVKLGMGGQVSLYNDSGSVHVLADVAGFYATNAEAAFNAVQPQRLLDTRAGNGAPAGTIGPNGVLELQVTNRGGVPVGATGVVLNVTAVGLTGAPSSYITAWPTGSTVPLASNLNMVSGQIIPNLVVARLGTGGKVSLRNDTGNVHLLADVAGYFGPTGSVFTPLAPSRLLDTRTGVGSPAVRVPAGGTVELQVVGRGGVQPGATAVVLNVTAVVLTGAANSWLTVWPTGEPLPLASNLNMVTGQVIPNSVVSKIGVNGKVSISNAAGSTDILADVAGFYSTG